MKMSAKKTENTLIKIRKQRENDSRFTIRAIECNTHWKCNTKIIPENEPLFKILGK